MDEAAKRAAASDLSLVNWYPVRARRSAPMRYKLIRRVDDGFPASPEAFDGDEAAKSRARELLVKYRSRVKIDVWNEDQTWRIVTPAGVGEWCKADQA